MREKELERNKKRVISIFATIKNIRNLKKESETKAKVLINFFFIPTKQIQHGIIYHMDKVNKIQAKKIFQMTD